MDSLRELISENRPLVFGIDFSTQPDSSLMERNPHLTLKDEKSLPLARESDVVLVSGEINKQYHAWLRSVGLGTDNFFEFGKKGESLTNIINSNDLSKVKSYLSAHIQNGVYVPNFSSRKDLDASINLGLDFFGSEPETALFFYDKGKFKDDARNLGLPVTKGYFSGIFDLKAGLDILKYYPQFIIKGISSSSGNSINIVTSKNAEKVLPHYVGKDVVIEELVDLDSEISLQWGINKKGIYFIGASDCSVTNFSYSSGKFPVTSIPDEVLQETISMGERYAAHMMEKGYVGIAGFDVIFSNQNPYFIENNARFNGSTFFHVMFENMISKPVNWRMERFSVNPQEVDNLLKTLSPNLYNGLKTNFVFPYDISNLDSNGSFIGLFAGDSLEEVNIIYNEVKSRLW